MSKSAPPEVWDFTSAEAFIKAGRNPERRPLKDGWNTELVKVDADEYVIRLHGESIVSYFRNGHILIGKGVKPDFVRKSRIEKYALGSRYKLLDYRGTWQLLEATQQLAHAFGDEDVSVYQPLMYVGDTLEFDDKGDIVPTHPSPSRMSASERVKFWRPLMRKWITGYMKLLEGEGVPRETQCKMCEPFNKNKDDWRSVGFVMSDPEHLFTHVLEGVYPGGFAMGAYEPTGAMKYLELKGTNLVLKQSSFANSIRNGLLGSLQREMKVY